MTGDKQTVSDRLAEADLAAETFVSVEDGKKRSLDHDTRYSDPAAVPGRNYGIYADEDDALVVLDVDDHREGDEGDEEAVGQINRLGLTLTIQSPHVDEDSAGGHRFFRLEGDETPAELFDRVFGRMNPIPSWGEVIAKNKYVVGPGSQLDACSKEWCDECDTERGGRYVVKHDAPVREVKAETLIEVLDADPDLEREDGADSQTLAEASFGDPDEYENDVERRSRSDTSSDGTTDGDLDAEEVKKLLDAIPGDQHFDDWIRTGYAVLGWDDTDTGKQLFEDWSKDNKKWDRKESQRQIDYIWQKGDADAGKESNAGVKTLEYIAREHGYDGDINVLGGRQQPAADEPDQSKGDGLTWDDVRGRYAYAEKEEDYTKGHARQAAADVLEAETSWMYVLESERLWVYDETTGQYDKFGSSTANRILERELGEYYSGSERREIVGRLEARNQVHRNVLNAREHDDPLVCVGNGVINLRTGELMDHSPEYRFVRGLSVDYEPADADPEKIVDFLDEVTQRSEDRDTLLDHLAHGLMPGHPYRAFVVCYGPGGNGKTQVSELFRGFVGGDNAAAVEIDELADGDFATGDLPGTFINWGDDMAGDGGGQLSDLSLLKKATGGSEIRANEKYEKTFNFKNEAAMFFSANEPPRIGEQKASIQDRIYPIEMPYRFKSNPDPANPMEKEKTPNVSKDLLEDDAAMKGMLLLAVKHAGELIDSRGRYSQPESPEERLEKYNRSADPIVKFAGRALEEASGDFKIRKDDAYRVFREFAESWEERAASERGFKRQLPGATTFEMETARSRALASPDDGEDRVRVWKRVRWTPLAREHMPEWLVGRYADHFEDIDDAGGEATSDADSSADTPTPLPERDAGYETFTATVTAEIDPKPWLEGEGTLVDETGAVIDYIIRDGSDDRPVLEEGEEYHFENARLTADEGGAPVVEIRPGATEANAASRPSGLDEHRDGDEEEEDGGDDDSEGVNKKIDRLAVEYVRENEPAPREDVAAEVAGMVGGADADRVDARLKILCSRGDLHEPAGDGLRSV